MPKSKQIRLDQFRLLPGDLVQLKHRESISSVAYINGIVEEVWLANPEYVLSGPKAKSAGVIRWKKHQRKECKEFLRGKGHRPVKIRLKKSAWAVMRADIPLDLSGGGTFYFKTRLPLYTYDIEMLYKEGIMRIFPQTDISLKKTRS
ncbi:MAG: hypothetical protein Q7R91_01770 [bacterium]|nr:hypothetical protein [bacterium]